MTAPRALARAARRVADQNTRKTAAADTGRRVVATVATVDPGAASDGNAVVTVTWRDGTAAAAGYASSYTPAVGHRVMCDLLPDGQLVVAYRIIGQP